MKRIKRIVTAAVTAALIFCMTLSCSLAENGTPVLSAEDQFTGRDLEQAPDLSGAKTVSVTDGQDVHLTAGGVYVLSGEASGTTIYVEAGEDEKVQLVLDGLTVTNTDFPVIYVKTADKVFITTSGDSSLSVTGTFTTDGDTGTDGVIFSKTDLTLNGTAALAISSSDNGIAGKDDVKITGGTYTIKAASKAIEANDSIRIAGGTLDLTAGTDGLHAENNEDNTKGYIYISGGTLTISAGDDAVHANTVVQVDGGSVYAAGAEGIEGTYIQFNGGTVSIQASDDGINAARKSSAYTPTVEINDGDITVTMGAGDTDGIDSNGNIIVNGGTVQVTGNSTFDYDGSAQYNGGVIIANGQQVNTIPNQMMGGRGGRGGWGGFGGGDPGSLGNGGSGSFGSEGSGEAGGFGGGTGGRNGHGKPGR